jgi:outer membrane protein, multidrug efflux system
MRISSAIGVALLFSLTACTVAGPDYHAPPITVPDRWQEQTADTIPAVIPAIRTWWSLFHDPLLDSMITRASVANYDLRIAEANIRAARAQRTIAAATGFIDGSAAATNSRRGSDNTSSAAKGSQTLFQLGFDAGWELDLFGGIQRAVEAADASLAASREDLHEVLVSLQAEVGRNYVELRGNQKRLATARKNIATQEKTVDLVRGRFQMGLGNELDLVQAETQLSLTRAQVPVLESLIQQAMHRLAILMAQPPASLIAELEKESGIPEGPAQIPVNMPSDLLRRRPDIRAAERRLAAATAEIGVATADLFPHFSLAALAGLQNKNISDLVSGGSRFWSVGPTLDLSLFDQGKRRAVIEISRARRDAALAFYQQTVLGALGEVEDGLVAFTHERETRRILGQAVTSGEKALMIANGRYETGLADFLNVLQSEQALYQSEDQLAQSEQRLTLSMIAIFKALGGGWQDDSKRGQGPISKTGQASDGQKTLTEKPLP